MESNQNNSGAGKIIWTYGLIAGAIVTVFMAGGIYYYDKNPNFDGGMYVGFTGMIVAFSFIFIGIKNYRDNLSNGIISFGRAFKIGLWICLIACTIYVGVWLIEYYCLYPDFMDKYAAMELKKLNAANLTPAQLQEKTEQIQMMKESYKSTFWIIVWTYIEILPIGILATLISALILKKKQIATS